MFTVAEWTLESHTHWSPSTVVFRSCERGLRKRIIREGLSLPVTGTLQYNTIASALNISSKNSRASKINWGSQLPSAWKNLSQTFQSIWTCSARETYYCVQTNRQTIHPQHFDHSILTDNRVLREFGRYSVNVFVQTTDEYRQAPACDLSTLSVSRIPSDYCMTPYRTVTNQPCYITVDDCMDSICLAYQAVHCALHWTPQYHTGLYSLL